MIRPEYLVELLQQGGIDFYAGVPDSLLKQLCACLTDRLAPQHHIIAANEGGALALATGHYIATGKAACVYMQNSGEGNIINPLASLTDPEVYHLPALLIIGWRGYPGVHDEPQHAKQGKITTSLLEVMGIEYDMLSQDEATAAQQIVQAMQSLQRGEVYALVVKKDTFAPYIAQPNSTSLYPMSREEAIQAVADAMGAQDVAVSTTGMISRELFEYREAQHSGHNRDFLTVGSMGHASQIALGIALAQPERRVWCFDGDGAVLMHMGSLAIVAQHAPQNYIHIVFNNGAHDSVGGQPTVGLDIDLAGVARAAGYREAYSVSRRDELLSRLSALRTAQGPAMLEIRVRKGNRKELGRPTTSPIENRDALMQFLER